VNGIEVKVGSNIMVTCLYVLGKPRYVASRGMFRERLRCPVGEVLSTKFDYSSAAIFIYAEYRNRDQNAGLKIPPLLSN
jgi:hypothetical protein